MNSEKIEKNDEISYEERKRRWKEIEQKFERDEDMDKKIFQTVVALNALGVETIKSCQGHLTDFKPSPHVELLTPKSNLLTGKNEEVAEIEYQQLIQKINSLLSEFYEGIETESDAEIELGLSRMENLVLRNGVEDYTSVKNITEKQLTAYQNEFEEFAKFLRTKYFSE